MKKRMISLLLAMVMLFSITPVMLVSAALTTTTLDSALNGLWKWNGSGWKVNGKTAEIVQGAGVDGSAALHIVGNSDAGNAANAFQVVSATALTKGNTYKVTFYAKNVTNLQNAKVCFGDWGQSALDVNASYAEDMGDGWYKFTFEKTVSSNVEFAFVCLTDTDGSYATYEELEFYVDKISIVNTADNSELLSYFAANFNEEPVATPEPTTAPEPTATPDTSNEETFLAGGTYGWWTNTTYKYNDQYLNYATLSTTEVYDGDKSAHIYIPASDGAAEWQFSCTTPITEVGTYTVTAYIKANDAALASKIMKPATNYNQQLLSATGTDWGVTTDKDGWLKYSYTATCDALKCVNFAIVLAASTDINMYIDNVSIVKNNGDGTTTEIIPATMGGFEFGAPIPTPTPIATATPEPTAVPTPAPTPDTSNEESFINYDYSNGWGYNTAYRANTTAHGWTKLTTEEVYDGNKAAHIYIPADAIAEGTNGPSLMVKGDYAITEAGSYTVTAYIKVVQGDMDNIKITNIGSWGQTALSSTSATWGVATDKEGWLKYSYTNANTALGKATQFTLNMPQGGSVVDMYIDNITVTKNNADGSTEIIPTNIGGFEFGKRVLTREEKIEALLPGTAEEAFMGGADWGTDTKHNNDQYKNYIKLSSDEAYAGGRSAHVLVPASDNAEVFQFSSKHLITQAGSYTVTMYAKIVKGDASKINLFTLGTWKQPAISTLTVEPTDKDGWMKYSQTVNVASVANNLQFALVLPAATDLDLYIDNVSVVVNGVNVLPDAASTFEPATIPAAGYTATATKLYTIDDAITTATEITELNAVDSGKTIIATATVANYTRGDSFTGQMILCFFDGDELKLARLGQVITIKETDSATKVSCIMDMPAFTDVSNLKIKAFLWNSLEGMMPLNSTLEI